MFFSLWRLVRPNQDGERGERLTNTLFGAKDGGHHHRKRTSALTSLRRSIRRCNFSFNKKISRIGQTTVCQFISPSVLVCLGFFFQMEEHREDLYKFSTMHGYVRGFVDYVW